MAKAKRKARKGNARSSGTAVAGRPGREGADAPVAAKGNRKANRKAKAPNKTTAKRAKAAASKPNYVQVVKQFLREVKIELKKVTWPSRKEAIGTTAVVLVLVGIVASYLGLVDAVLTKALTTLMR